ncbi:MAG: MFS transporter [Pseudonocardiales bacterium]|nr:MAG: MFS transporter [Pseudonocardiales bacterium]
MSQAQATYRETFAVSEFRALWVAQIFSIVGDYLARIALSVLVFHRTGSTFLTATIFAVSFLPPVIGGPILAGLADRYPRRTVMVLCDLLRAALVALMVISHVPILVLAALLFVTELLASPFSAARSATLPDVLPGDLYVMGSAVSNITNELGQVFGLGVGGTVVAVLGTHGALGVDAATFLLSAVVLRLGVRKRGIDQDEESGRVSLLAGTMAGTRLVFGQPRLRALVCLAWLCAFYVVPEGLAVPYAASLGGGAATAGLLLAANPAGTVLGAVVVSRLFTPPRRLQLMGPLAVLSCVPLLGFVAKPGLVWATVLLAVSGIGSAYNLPANAAFVAAVPSHQRGQAFGLVASGMSVFQGVALLAGGALAQFSQPSLVIAGAGAAGVVVALLLAAAPLRPGRLAVSGAPVPAG